MTRAILCILILCLTSKTFGKKFTESEMVAELRKQGFPENQLKFWLCIINKDRDTHVLIRPQGSASNDYILCGLFRQPADMFEPEIIDCDVACYELLSDDITLAANCAKKVYAEDGPLAWEGFFFEDINCSALLK